VVVGALPIVAGAVPVVAGAVPVVAGVVPVVAGVVPVVAGAVARGRDVPRRRDCGVVELCIGGCKLDDDDVDGAELVVAGVNTDCGGGFGFSARWCGGSGRAAGGDITWPGKYGTCGISGGNEVGIGFGSNGVAM